eukprot:724188-Pleurochrysis_carterae.AAC.2
MWDKLRGRFFRPHLATGGSSADVGESTGTESLRRPVTEDKSDESLPLPVVNSVTGINHAPGARRAAKASVDARATASELPELSEVDEDIIAGGLYFIEIP